MDKNKITNNEMKNSMNPSNLIILLLLTVNCPQFDLCPLDQTTISKIHLVLQNQPWTVALSPHKYSFGIPTSQQVTNYKNSPMLCLDACMKILYIKLTSTPYELKSMLLWLTFAILLPNHQYWRNWKFFTKGQIEKKLMAPSETRF